MKDWKTGRLERCKGILTWWTLKHECAGNTCINWIHWDVVGFEWRFNSSNSRIQIFFNLNLVWDLSFSRLFVHRVYRRPFFVVTLNRVRVCVCVCQPSQGPLCEIPTEFELGFVIQGWTVDPGEDRGWKRMWRRRRMTDWRRESWEDARFHWKSLHSVWSQRMRI